MPTWVGRLLAAGLAVVILWSHWRMLVTGNLWERVGPVRYRRSTHPVTFWFNWLVGFVVACLLLVAVVRIR